MGGHLHGPGQQLPLSHKARHGRRADHGKRSHRKGRKGKGHGAPQAAHLRNALLVRGHIDSPGAEKERNLGKGVVGNVHNAALNAVHGKQGHAQNDVGKLAHRGIGQPRLKVVLGQRDDRGRKDGEGNKIGRGHAQVEAFHQVCAEDVEHDPRGAEHAHLHHGHSVQQGRHRRRRNHGPRQPVVQRHDAVFGKAQQAADVEHRGQGIADPAVEDALVAVVGKVQIAREHVDDDHGGQHQTLGRSGQVDDILARAFIPLFVLVVGHQGVGADADHLIEQVEGKEVVRKGHAHGSEQGQRETDAEAGLGVLLEAAHVARRVEHGDNPQK